MSREMTTADDGAVRFGKPEMSSEQGTIMFGGMTELMSERRPSPLAQVAAAEWLVHGSAGEMKRLGIHTIESEKAP